MAAASFDRSESSAMIKLHPDGRTPDNIPVYVLQVPVAVLLKVRSPWGGGIGRWAAGARLSGKGGLGVSDTMAPNSPAPGEAPMSPNTSHDKRDRCTASVGRGASERQTSDSDRVQQLGQAGGQVSDTCEPVGAV